MRKIAFILTMVLLFSYTLLQAAPKEKTIVVGTFAVKQNAERTLERLKKALKTKEDISQLKESVGFEYVTRKSGPYYIVAIEPIVEYDVLNQVLSAARDVFADAFVNIMSKNIEVEITDDGYSSDEVQELEESAAEDALEAQDEEDDQDDETLNDEVVDNSNQEVQEDTEDETVNEVITKEPSKPIAVTPTAEQSGDSDNMMLYIAVAVVLLLLIVAVLVKRKKSSKVEETTELEEIMPNSIVDDTTPIKEDKERESSNDIAEEVTLEHQEDTQEQETATLADDVVEDSATVQELEEPTPSITEAVAPKSRKKREKDISRSKIQKSDFNKFTGARILIAEDNLINQKVITGLLADSGMELVIAEDGQICLDILANDKDFDLVLMDAHMPNVDGFEATRAIRTDASLEHIPVIALSGDTSADDIRKMNEAGMEDTLEKPLKMDALFDVFYCYIDLDKDNDNKLGNELVEPTIPEKLPEIEIDAPAIEHLENNLPINSAIGIQIAGGDKELYLEIVNEFAKMYHESDIQLNSMMQEGHYDEALSLLLDVQGLAGNIGAGELYEIATLYRVAINERNQEKIETMQNRYSMEFLAVIDQIEKGDL